MEKENVLSVITSSQLSCQFVPTVYLFQFIGHERGVVRNNHDNHEKGKRKDLPRKIYRTKLWATKTVAATKAIIVKVCNTFRGMFDSADQSNLQTPAG